MTRPDGASARRRLATPRIEYRPLHPAHALPADLLAAVVFGEAYARHDDPRCVRVGLEPLAGPGVAELWHAAGAVRIGFDGPLRYAADAAHLAGAIELDERDFADLEATARAAYAALRRFQQQSEYPHLLRVWNYFDGINRGSGDEERYKQFCLGRAQGLEVGSASRLPAATAIGRRDGSTILQVYWLAGRSPGVPLENPRQLSAYRYPREYGSHAPVFSRATLLRQKDSLTLFISGTASIVGHRSIHVGDTAAQTRETLANIAALLEEANRVERAARFSLGSLACKVYVRRPQDLPVIRAELAAALEPTSKVIYLQADICRQDLLVEIEATGMCPLKADA